MSPVLISTVLGLSLIPSTISSVLASPNYNNVSQKISPTIKVQRSQLNKNRIFWSKIFIFLSRELDLLLLLWICCYYYGSVIIMDLLLLLYLLRPMRGWLYIYLLENLKFIF